METFAEQASLAIASATTLRDLRVRTAELAERNTAYSERIEQQAATINVLQPMSVSPGDPQPVFDLIVRQARALCGSRNAGLFEYDGTMLHYRARSYAGGLTEEYEAYRRSYPRPMTRDPLRSVNTAILEGRIVHIRDASNRALAVQRLGTLPLLSAALAMASARHRSSVPAPMPILAESASTGQLCGGSSRATALSLNVCPYRAMFVFQRPLRS